VRVLRQLSDALNVSAEILLAHAGLLDKAAAGGDPDQAAGVERAIKDDGTLDDSQKAALLAVYQSMTRPQPSAG
jgi:hypothetical protein